jgi:hypothetical protein
MNTYGAWFFLLYSTNGATNKINKVITKGIGLDITIKALSLTKNTSATANANIKQIIKYDTYINILNIS